MQDLASGLAKAHSPAIRPVAPPPPPPTDAEVQAAIERFRREVLRER